MKFIWPWMLLFLFLVPLLAWLYFRLQARRRKLARAFSGLGLGSKALPRPGAEQNYGAIKVGNSLQVCFGQAVERVRRPVFDQAPGRQKEAFRQWPPIHGDAPGIIGGDGEQTGGDGGMKLHSGREFGNKCGN